MYQTEIAFYDWTIVSVEDNTQGMEYGCEYYEDCPCCNCDDAIVKTITMVRPRYSRSTGRVVEDTRTWWVCSAHTSADLF